METKEEFNVPDLAELLKYRHQHTIDRFLKDWKVEREQADAIFEDLLRFLWLSVKLISEGKRAVPITSPMGVVDEMWHTFILFTSDYTRFGRDFFGRYLHHNPNVDERETDLEAYAEKLRGYCRTVYEYMGRDVMHRWFGEYNEKYSRQKLAEISIHSRIAAFVKEGEHSRSSLRDSAT